MKVTPNSHPELWVMHDRHKKYATVLHPIHRLGFFVKDEDFKRFRDEADRSVKYLNEKERDAWAAHCALTHPDCKSVISVLNASILFPPLAAIALPAVIVAIVTIIAIWGW